VRFTKQWKGAPSCCTAEFDIGILREPPQRQQHILGNCQRIKVIIDERKASTFGAARQLGQWQQMRAQSGPATPAVIVIGSATVDKETNRRWIREVTRQVRADYGRQRTTSGGSVDIEQQQ
uniref:Uma2 domain-containing protein n=1 Tax=Ascaris lumbricoides TaxID=6252 RepID=A0A0M3I6C0_ASCLU